METQVNARRDYSRGSIFTKLGVTLLALAALATFLTRLKMEPPSSVIYCSLAFQLLFYASLWQGSRMLLSLFRLYLIMYCFAFFGGLMDIVAARNFFQPFMYNSLTITVFLLGLTYVIWCFFISRTVREFFSKNYKV